MLSLGRVRFAGTEEAWRERCAEPELETKTDMTSTKETRFFKEPTHDEIALHAFLAWERDGRPQSSDLNYWLLAESNLRTQRLQLAEAAAAKAARPWPPASRVKAVKAKLAATAAKTPAPKAAAPVRAVKKTATAARTAPVKVTRTAKTAAHPASLPARATSARASR